MTRLLGLGCMLRSFTVNVNDPGAPFGNLYITSSLEILISRIGFLLCGDSRWFLG